MTDGKLPTSIVIPLANPRTAADLVRIGAALLQEGGAITALSIVEVPEGVQLSEGATRARQARRLLQRVLEFVPEGVELRTVVRIGRRADEGIVELAAEEEADLILFGWGGPDRARRSVAERDDFQPIFSPTIDEVIRERPCDIAVVKQRGIGTVRRILAPVRGGPHAELALRYASALQQSFQADLDVLHVVAPGVDPAIKTKAQRNLGLFVERHTGDASSAKVIEGEDVTEAILDEADDAQIVIMGATATAMDSPGAPLFGQLVEHVAQEAAPTVIVVKTRDAPTRATFAERAKADDSLEAAEEAAGALRSLPAKVNRWFAESSFDFTEFRDDIKRLVQLKEKQGLTISAVLPTLNEAETIGPIVRTARRELMKEPVNLIDELIVIDSNSEDDTRTIAEDEGARVVIHQEVLPKYGAYNGKGEALWKSLYVSSGDLVAWCDTDVREWDARFLYGTLGPLLTQPRVGYVKAYYQRPIVQGGVLTAGGGGRVTELVARPLINLFFPELSGIIQPLSGEYAGRRELLESIPFFASYAVEIGHLMDLSQKMGIEGFAQVDLEVRHHRNQDLEGLSKMAFVITQAVMKRLDEQGHTPRLADLGTSMHLPRYQRGQLKLDSADLADVERRPMLEIPEYRRKRGLPENPE